MRRILPEGQPAKSLAGLTVFSDTPECRNGHIMDEDFPVYDAVMHLPWKRSLTVLCRHPAVCDIFGHGEPCAVCIYTCFRCRFVKRYKWHGGISCGYEDETLPDRRSDAFLQGKPLRLPL